MDAESIHLFEHGNVKNFTLFKSDQANQISQQVRVEIQKEWPAVRDVVVHIEPFYPEDH